MALIQINHNPTTRQVRQFVAIAMVALPTLTWWWLGISVPFLVALVGVSVLAILGWVRPESLKLVFVAACYLAYPIGWCLGWLALIGLFVGLFVPFAVVFRLIGRDRLQLSRPKNAQSYWSKKRSARSVASYYRQS